MGSKWGRCQHNVNIKSGSRIHININTCGTDAPEFKRKWIECKEITGPWDCGITVKWSLRP